MDFISWNELGWFGMFFYFPKLTVLSDIGNNPMRAGQKKWVALI